VAKRLPIVDSLGRTQEVRVLGEPDVMRQLDDDEKGAQIVSTPGAPSLMSAASRGSLLRTSWKS
jgi:hypothetical protein